MGARENPSCCAGIIRTTHTLVASSELLDDQGACLLPHALRIQTGRQKVPGVLQGGGQAPSNRFPKFTAFAQSPGQPGGQAIAAADRVDDRHRGELNAIHRLH